MRFGRTKREAGFSLLELGIVLIVMGMLASVAVPMVTATHQRYMREQDKQILEAARNAILGYAGSAWGLPCMNAAGNNVAIDCNVAVTFNRLGVRATDSRNQPLIYHPSWMLTAAALQSASGGTNSKTYFCNASTEATFYKPNDLALFVSNTFGAGAAAAGAQWDSTTASVLDILISDNPTNPDAAFPLTGTAGATNGLAVRALPSVCLDRNWDTRVRAAVNTCNAAAGNPSLTTGEAARQAFVLIATGEDQALNLDNSDIASYIRVFENPSRPSDLDTTSATGYYDDIVVGISPAELKARICQ